MQLLILASVLTVGLCLPGGYTNQDLSDPAVKQSYLDKLVLLKSKNLIFASENSLPQLTLLSVKSQVVNGVNYNYTVQIGDKVCSIQFYEQSWTGTYEIKSDDCKVQKRQLAGGYTTQNKDDPKYAEILAKLSSDGKIQLPANANSYDLVSVQTQVVAGINYKFTLQMHGQTCEIVYYEASWMNKYEITSDSCSQLTHSKRGLAGGWSPVTDTSDAGVQACLGASLDKLNSMANSMYRMVDKSIDSIDQQVVAGMKYRYTVQVAPSTCIKSQANMGFTSVSCPVDTNHIMQSQTWSGSCVYAPWQTPKTQLLEFHMGAIDVPINKVNNNNNNNKLNHVLGSGTHDLVNNGKELLGTGIHDLLNHGKHLFGADGHDFVKHGRQLLGGDAHDLLNHGKQLLGGDTHDLVNHGKQLLGGDAHDLVNHGKQLLGGDTHDLVNHGKQLLGGDAHDLVNHGKQLIGQDIHDLVNHGKQLLGGDTHDLVNHGKQQLGGDTHDLVNHGKQLLGGDTHDLVNHGKQLLGGDTHDLVNHVYRKLIGQDGHDSQAHGNKTTEEGQDCSTAMFKDFQKTHNKLYRSQQDEAKRYMIFCDNMRKARKLQETEQGTARYGPTKFADLTEAEFKQYVGKKWDINAMKTMKRADIPKGSMPDSFDWRDHGAVTPVKNQGSCGSCWAFSTTGNIEGQWAIKKRALISLSEQELVDCDKVDEGCNGGLPSNAYKEIERLGGLETESEYSYKGAGEKCEFVKRDVKVYINDSVSISSNETEMASWLAANGPISIGINAFAMQFYMGGISHPWKLFCNPSELDHGVLIVGYGVQGSKPYWIVKNSWGPDWGEKGYYLVYRGAGVCGLNTMCTSSVVE